MRTSAILMASVVLQLIGAKPVDGMELSQLNVLYVGSERTSDYVDFLQAHVANLDAQSRADFKPESAEPYDVVLLDWPQSEETREMRKLTSPLGTRDGWKKSTVLLVALASIWQ